MGVGRLYKPCRHNIGELIKSKFTGVGHLYKPCDIIEDMRQDYDINMIYKKAWRARENVYEGVRRCPKVSYNLLLRYDETLKLSNLCTIFHMELELKIIVFSNIFLWWLVHVLEDS